MGDLLVENGDSSRSINRPEVTRTELATILRLLTPLGIKSRPMSTPMAYNGAFWSRIEWERAHLNTDRTGSSFYSLYSFYSPLSFRDYRVYVFLTVLIVSFIYIYISIHMHTYIICMIKKLFY